MPVFIDSKEMAKNRLIKCILQRFLFAFKATLLKSTTYSFNLRVHKVSVLKQFSDIKNNEYI